MKANNVNRVYFFSLSYVELLRSKLLPHIYFYIVKTVSKSLSSEQAVLNKFVNFEMLAATDKLLNLFPHPLSW